MQVALSVKYEKINLSAAQDGIKVISVTGKYSKRFDPQMTCSKFEIQNSTYGRFYTDLGKYTRVILPTNPEVVKRTVSSPTLGKDYTIYTNQKDYVAIDPGFSGARMYYTAKRTTSSYTSDSWVGINFGRMTFGG